MSELWTRVRTYGSLPYSNKINIQVPNFDLQGENVALSLANLKRGIHVVRDIYILYIHNSVNRYILTFQSVLSPHENKYGKNSIFESWGNRKSIIID